jgi:hypothetical protein
MKLLETDNPCCPKCGIKLDPIDKRFINAKDDASQKTDDSDHHYD